MEKNVAHDGWTTSLLTVAGQHGGLWWLGGCGTASGTMEWKKRRIGLVQEIGCISQLYFSEFH